MSDAAVRLGGMAREAGAGTAMACEVILDQDAFAIAISGTAPLTAAYRDISTLAVDGGRALLVLGEGDVRMFLERFGAGLGTLVRELRERRARQRLADRLVRPPPDPLPLVEYQAGPEHGVAQLVYHPWGALLLPLDERRPWRDIRRAGIEALTLRPDTGAVEVTSRATFDGAPEPPLRMPGLGQDARVHHDRFAALRDAAATDAAGLVGALMPDAPFAVRRQAAALLVDGRPVMPGALGDGWPWLEGAVLGEPIFAASYAALRARAGDGPTWVALAPAEPGSPEAKVWFFVALPGNLVALELVSEGAHATYCFRVLSRADYRGEAPAARAMAEATGAVVAGISHALVDARYLREPIALPDEQLRQPRNLRYRLALAALPALAAARQRFVARLVHRSGESWSAALDSLIAWHGASRDDAEAWPGRAAQEAEVDAAAREAATGDDSPSPSG